MELQSPIKYKTLSKKPMHIENKRTPVSKLRITRHKVTNNTTVKQQYKTLQSSPVRKFTESQKSSLFSPKTTAVGSLVYPSSQHKSSTLSTSISPKRTMKKLRKGAPIREVHLKITNY